jgi:hypothetical protein
MKPANPPTCATCANYQHGPRYIRSRDGYCRRTDGDVRSWWCACEQWEKRQTTERTQNGT